ncbi:MAG: response regulator transcription factor [Gammaproteobacteria bacterium]|nr:response regulator transcription factor [Gammaproteobacteria bacterium]
MNPPSSTATLRSSPPAAPLRVLVVEDEEDLRQAMSDYLELEGWELSGAGDIASCQAWVQDPRGGVVVLDLGLPDGDGLAGLAQRLDRRRHGLVLATARGRLQDRIRGYDEGGDAYLVKPVDLRELVAVVRGVASRLASQTADSRPGVWSLGGVEWRLTAPNGAQCMLSNYEVRLLQLFVNQPGQTLTKEEVIRGVDQEGKGYDPRSLEILVRRLRNKCQAELDAELPLQTVHGIGYAFLAELRICG